MYRVTLATLLLQIAVLGCSGNKSESGCSVNTCDPGYVCVERDCLKVCESDLNCPDGSICEANTCVVGGRAGEPTITAVDGDSTMLDGASGHVAHLAEGRVVIRGTNLLGAQVTLRNMQREWELTVCSTGDTEIAALLPSDLPASAGAATSYTLSVANQVSSCSATLPVLQGTPGEPQTSIDGLGGGSISSLLNVNGTLTATDDFSTGGNAAVAGDAQVSGDVTIGGSLIVGGVALGYPDSPRVLMGVSYPGCQSSAAFNTATVIFPANFAAAPILVATIDETGDNNGAFWTRVLRGPFSNRAMLHCNALADGVHWLALDAGDHTISGKKIAAGRLDLATTNASVFFPSIFPTEPVVLTEIDESGDDSGAIVTRVISTVTTGGFQISLDAAADGLHWVAMEPGLYQSGRFRWVAGAFEVGNACSNPCTFDFPAEAAFSTAPGVLLTVNDTDNSGAYAARLYSVTPTSVSFRTFNGGGAVAATERVYYVAFEELR